MNIYRVQLRINVPSVGEAQPIFEGIQAATIEDAIKDAKARVIIEPIAAQKTGETP